MDDLDHAQELEMQSRNAAIAVQRAKQKILSLSHCAECSEPIPITRQKLGGVIRCIDCQHYFERKQHGRK
jgi:phage/conjugal plasmid C-4 type zinc finger TraR family protein